MFEKILIANRGEIAVRIIRACKEMGIKTVAVYSDVDKESLHVKLADEAYCIGPASPSQSYLNIPSIISVAEISGAKAIHPGYGFLAENPKFAEVCQSSGIRFIGPTASTMEKVGDKASAKKMAQKARVPIVGGSEGIINDEKVALHIAKKIGYPVLIKATAGGGGKGMRIAFNDDEFPKLFKTARAEAESSFANPDVYIEKYIENPRHVEFQILADGFGNIVHLGERDCSIQRRHQKLIEESPSVALDDKLRAKMGEAAVKIAKAADYIGAGTVEFLLDSHHHFYFIEMNARVQVEHPVTEMITSIDIIKEQIMVESGERLAIRQKDIRFLGHAIECRINAEDPERSFMPCPGEVSIYLPPGGPGIRVDSHVYPGYRILPNYDSLIAKLIAWGNTRSEAIARMKRALDEFIIDGISTTIPLHQRIMDNEVFQRGDINTSFIKEHIFNGS